MKHALALSLALPLLLGPTQYPSHAQAATARPAKRAHHDLTPPRPRLNATAPAIAPPFADVPKDHWAFASVEALRKAGIITGEPVGRYQGK